MYFASKTRQGKWSIGIDCHFFLCFAAMRIIVILGQRAGEGIITSPFLPVFGIGTAVFGIAAFFVGIFDHCRGRKIKKKFVLIFLF